MSSLPALAPLELLYRAVLRTRSVLYRRGWLVQHRIDAPVISVGNITTGGTGKTPLVEWVARAVQAESRRVCVLTRGYGREKPSRRVVVSDGERLLADASEGGDEPRVLAENLLGIAAVISDRDRVSSARWALENLQTECFVLDDAFQHFRLARDLDLVTIDATAPWGGGHLLPRGRLRESLDSLARADCIVLTRADLADDVDELRERVRQLAMDHVPVLSCRTSIASLRTISPVESELRAIPNLLNTKVAAFCGIGNPRAFFTSLGNEGYEITHSRAFPDHHVYVQQEIDAFEHSAKNGGALALLTTPKDAVKLSSLQFSLPLYAVESQLHLDDESALRELLGSVLQRKQSIS